MDQMADNGLNKKWTISYLIWFICKCLNAVLFRVCNRKIRPNSRRQTFEVMNEASNKLFIIIKIKYSMEWKTHQNGII